MTEPTVDPALDAGHSFEPYTAFAPAEELLERQLGASSKLQLPERHRRNFVRFLPWAALLFLPAQLLGLLVLLGVTALSAMFGAPSIGGALLTAVVLALNLAALPGLFGATRRGWTFYVYGLSLSTIANLLSLSLFGLLINAGLLWIAFQVKYHYR